MGRSRAGGKQGPSKASGWEQDRPEKGNGLPGLLYRDSGPLWEAGGEEHQTFSSGGSPGPRSLHSRAVGPLHSQAWSLSAILRRGPGRLSGGDWEVGEGILDSAACI